MRPDWRPIFPATYPECKVIVADGTGKRWAMTVQAGSLYAAVFAYSCQQISGQHRDYPALGPDTPVEVVGPQGTYSTSLRKAMAWANKQAR